MTEKAQHILEKLGALVDISKYHVGNTMQLVDAALSQHAITRYMKKKMPAQQFEQLRQQMAHTLRPAGTISKNPTTGKKEIWLHQDIAKGPKDMKNMVLHHEAFHAQVPVVGGSESLAHIYGGLHSGHGLMGELGPVKMYGHLWKTRPGRAAMEHGSVVGAGMVGKGIYNKATGNKKDIDNPS